MIVKLLGVPEQLFEIGVTKIEAVMGILLILEAMNGFDPEVPLAAKPMDRLVLLH